MSDPSAASRWDLTMTLPEQGGLALQLPDIAGALRLRRLGTDLVVTMNATAGPLVVLRSS